MTISSEVRKAGPYAGNGTTTSFPFLFKVFTSADVGVVVADVLGAETPLIEGVDYTVSLSANQDVSPGGSVATTVPVAVGDKLVVFSQVRSLQPTDLSNQGGFYPAVINSALDRAIILIQQLSEKIDRSAKLPITRTEDVDSLLADVVLLAENIAFINTVAANIGSVNAVAGVSAGVSVLSAIAADITTVAGIPSDVSGVAAIAGNVSTVAGIAADVPTVAASSANVATVAGSIAGVNTAAGSIANVNTVAANIANINAAVADLPALAAKVSKTGDTMSGPLGLPVDQTGSNARRADQLIWKVDGAARIPNWTTATRPVSPETGDTGFNTTIDMLETYRDDGWVPSGALILGPYTAAGSSFDVTSLPAWAKQIDIIPMGVDNLRIAQLGTSNEVVATGYTSVGTAMSSTVATDNEATGFLFRTFAVGAAYGVINLRKTGTNDWSASYALTRIPSEASTMVGAGKISLPGYLDRIRFVARSSSTFGAGTVYLHITG